MRRNQAIRIWARPVPFLCYLTIDGLGREPAPRTATQLRGRIHAAIRTAAEGRQTTYHATGSTITIGIRGHVPRPPSRLSRAWS